MANWWEPSPDAVGEPTLSVTKLNDEEGPIIPQLVSNDLQNSISHPNIMTACLVWAWEDTKAQRPSKVNSTLDWRDLKDEAILQLNGGDGSNFTQEELGSDYLEAHGFWEPCSVIKEEDSGQYTVQVLSKLGKNEDRRPDFLTNYPRESICYFMKPIKAISIFLMHSVTTLKSAMKYFQRSGRI